MIRQEEDWLDEGTGRKLVYTKRLEFVCVDRELHSMHSEIWVDEWCLDGCAYGCVVWFEC